ncbi:hypothetical protein [Microbacterium rhizosphaerae]|uniref:Uncharacterized protein n=1 Tax=Microbacterium rhizosphaerae TaxID=1678237 RepID=A0ABZ0SNI6_9MICO|nr:hypothetical protein [Microbacterium rhizosphaerae]WPR90899.1 hypothetical protein SM116_06285 [Microbacterium rhizosphaerae]
MMQGREVLTWDGFGAATRAICSFASTDQWIDFPWSARGTVVEEDSGAVSPA